MDRDKVSRVALICYTLHTMLYITTAHEDKLRRAAVISHSLYMMLHITDAHGNMLSGDAMISHTLSTMLLSLRAIETWFQGLPWYPTPGRPCRISPLAMKT